MRAVADVSCAIVDCAVCGGAGKCFYQSLCKAEGVPHLTKVFCALDKALFSPVSASMHGVEFKLASTLADSDIEQRAEDGEKGTEDRKCDFVFTRVSKSSARK